MMPTKMPRAHGKSFGSRQTRPSRAGPKVPKVVMPTMVRKILTTRAATGSADGTRADQAGRQGQAGGARGGGAGGGDGSGGGGGGGEGGGEGKGEEQQDQAGGRRGREAERHPPPLLPPARVARPSSGP